MNIDFALDAELQRGEESGRSIYQACLLRFRPIDDHHGGALCWPSFGMGRGTVRSGAILGVTIIGGLW